MARDIEERRKELAQRQAVLQQRAARLAKEEKAWEDRRKIIVGATVLNAMEKDADLAARVVAALKTAVVRDTDKKHVRDLIGETAASTPEPAKEAAAT